MSEELWAKFFELMEDATSEGREKIIEAAELQGKDIILREFAELFDGDTTEEVV